MYHVCVMRVVSDSGRWHRQTAAKNVNNNKWDSSTWARARTHKLASLRGTRCWWKFNILAQPVFPPLHATSQCLRRLFRLLLFCLFISQHIFIIVSAQLIISRLLTSTNQLLFIVGVTKLAYYFRKSKKTKHYTQTLWCEEKAVEIDLINVRR